MDCRWGPVVKAQVLIVFDPTHARPVRSVVGPTDCIWDFTSGGMWDFTSGFLSPIRFRFSASRSRLDRFPIFSSATSVGELRVTCDPSSRVRVSGIARGVTERDGNKSS
uniref:Uncharacterized protein n=1 Tax=Solanum tuberosum TaxID=4113 RepID=M1E1D1_SOLTU